jgi:hypothetical protein
MFVFFFFVQYTYEVWWELATHRKGQSSCTHPVLAAPEDVVVDFLNNFPFVFILVVVCCDSKISCVRFFRSTKTKKLVGVFYLF